MLGAAPRQAPSTREPSSRTRWVCAASIVLVSLVLFPALAGAAAHSGAHPRLSRRPSARVQEAAIHRTKLDRLPRLWAVEVSPAGRGWFDRALLKRVSTDGVNALVVRTAALGRTRAATREFDSVRRFAAGERLYLIAVLPGGRPHTPATRNALAACSSHRFSWLRCAVQAKSSAAAARLARKHNSVRRLVAVYVRGPRRFSSPTGLRGSARRPILVIAPLYAHFDSPAWGAAIAQTAASPSVDMGVAPRTSRASAALQQFGAMLASESGAAGAPADTTPPSTPAGLATSEVTQSSLTLSWDASTDDVGVAGYRLYENGNQVGASSSTSFSFSRLNCGTSYTLGVAAYDAAGNLSAMATTSESTTACSDTQPPSAPTGLAVNGIGSTGVTLSWNAAADDVGVTEYRLFVNGIGVGTSLTTSYLFGGLSCQSAYTLGVAAADAAGNISPVTSVIAQTALCSDTQPPSTPTGLATGSVSQSSVTLSWSASTDNVGVAGYRLFLNGSQVGTSTSTSYAFSKRACGVSYTLGVAAFDAAGNVSGTATAQKSTSACPDTQPPSTPTGLAAGGAGSASVTLSWSASTDNVGVAGYRLFLNGSQVGTSTSTSYSFTGLTCGTSYTLGVAAYDAAGNVSGTATVSQSTSACPDTQPPSAPTGLATGSVSQSSVTLSWSASTDNVGVAGYRLFLNGSQVGTSTSTSYAFSGLVCGVSYTLAVAAYDAAGNVSGTATAQKSTTACPDTQPPSTPTGLATGSVSQSSVALSWSASTDNVAVTGYRLFLNGSQVGTSTSTSYSFTGLTCGTSYTLGVAATDAAGNVSPVASVIAQTAPCSDTQPPSTPTGLATGSVSQSSVALSWSASTDNVAVTGYRLFLNGSQVGTTTSTSYSFAGLSCGTSYTFGVAAYDAAGNVSGTATVQKSTSACPDTQPPSSPTGLAAGGAGSASVTLSWSASSDNVGVTGYRLFLNGSQVGTSASTSYSFTGLTCGTSYTLGVAAYDAAGNVSGTASAGAATTACSSGGPTANVWVDTNGGSCVRQASAGPYLDAQACGTFGAAYQAAHAGDTVAVMPGSYGVQDLPNRTDLAVGSAPVTFCVASGGVTLTNALSIDTHDITVDGGICGAANAWGGTGAHMTVTSSPSTPEVVVGDPNNNATVNRNVTVENVHMAAFYGVAGGTNLVYDEIGPITNAVCSSSNGPVDLVDMWGDGDEGTPNVGSTIAHDYIHEDYCTTGAHVDAIQAETSGLTVAGNRIANCSQLFDESISTPSNFSRFSGNTLVNNMIEMLPDNYNDGKGDKFNPGCDGEQAVSSGPPYTVENNTIDGSFNANGVGGGANSVVVGNILVDSCGGAGTCDYNVFLSGHGDGTHAKVCDPLLGDGSLVGATVEMANLHLSAADTCAAGAGDPSLFPTSDLDGQTRTSPVWAGADQP